jgi:hypothetical protein
MYGWVTPVNKYVEVNSCCHRHVGDHCDIASDALKDIEDFDYSVYDCLYSKGFIRVVSFAGKATFNGDKRHLAEKKEKLTRLADRHGLIADFEFEG